MSQSKFVAYYRVSTERQGRSGLGVEAQQSAVRHHLSDCKGQMVKEFTEVESGKLNERPELTRALHLCKVTGAKLLIAKLDRLSRNASFLLSLRDSGVRFVCADNPEANELTIGILAVVAEDERLRISERTKAALQVAKIKGARLGNPNGAKAIKDLGNKAAVQKIRTLARNRAADIKPIIIEICGGKPASLSQIAEELTKRGIETPRGGKWHRSSVKNLLRSIGAAVT